jgi:hypothetical protein
MMNMNSYMLNMNMTMDVKKNMKKVMKKVKNTSVNMNMNMNRSLSVFVVTGHGYSVHIADEATLSVDFESIKRHLPLKVMSSEN